MCNILVTPRASASPPLTIVSLSRKSFEQNINLLKTDRGVTKTVIPETMKSFYELYITLQRHLFTTSALLLLYA